MNKSIESLKIQPLDIEAERSVLGIVIIDNSKLYDVLSKIKPSDIYDNKHKTILEAMISLIDKNEAIDLLTLKNELNSMDKFDLVGGINYITRLADDTFSSANLEYYLKIIKEKSIARKLIPFGRKISDDSYDNVNPDKIIDYAFNQLIELKNIDERKLFNIQEETENIYDSIVAKGKEPEKYGGVMSGHLKIDELIGGFHKQELIYMGGIAGVGKSALALNWINHISQKKKVLLFSLEMSTQSIINRLLSMRLNINNKMFRKGISDAGKLLTIKREMENIKNLKLWIDDNPTDSDRLISSAHKYKAMLDVDIIVVDYFFKIKAPERKRFSNETAMQTYISNALMDLAKSLDVPLIVIHGLNKIKGKKPTREDLRGSGTLANDAHIIFLLHSEELTDEGDNFTPTIYDQKNKEVYEVNVIIDKNRDAPKGEIDMNFYAPYLRFKEVDR
jgi:replicative DNA helicase